MRVAALYDIHGNLPALEAVLEDVRRAGVDEIVVGGDVFPGPMAGESLAFLLGCGIPVRFIRGNGEREVLAAAAGEPSTRLPEQVREALRWAAERLDPGRRREMASWPETARASIEGIGEVLFCHATPRNDSEIFTRLTPEDRLRAVFDGVGDPLIVCGHTHMQFDRTVGLVRVVNAGSVGMPFGEPGAYWLLLGPEVSLRRTTYELAAAAERVRGTGYPGAREFAERNVLRPPGEQEMLEVFSRVEL
jgi:predicted phosphodiesterase